MINWIKHRLARRELQALSRYRMATQLVCQWNGRIAGSAATAEWIRQVGDGERLVDIEQFRDRLRADAVAVPPEMKPELCAPISHEWMARQTGYRDGWNACRAVMFDAKG